MLKMNGCFRSLAFKAYLGAVFCFLEFIERG